MSKITYQTQETPFYKALQTEVEAYFATKNKEKIGDNLGNFVVENFLSPKNIRPYIQKIKISNFVGDWLGKERNQEVLMKEVSNIILDILHKLDDTAVVSFIGKKAKEMSDDLKINHIVGNGIEYILDKKDHQRFITNLRKSFSKWTFFINHL